MVTCRLCLLLLTLFCLPQDGLLAQNVAPTTVEPLTVEPLTVEPLTVEPTSVEPTPAEPTSVEPTTVEPTTVEPTTVEPTTVEPTTVEPTSMAPIDAYVIPITGAIGTPNLYILRRGLKEAIVNDVGIVILDMDTPGGRVDITLEMMEMLDRFDGITATYVNDDAISAGSFIAAATQEIYFSPRGKMGASAVIQGTGEDVAETAKQKIESYLRANIRVMTEDYPYRSDVVRAMLDADFELKIGDEVIKPVGELLTLTAREAVKEYGDPPHKLLGEGIYESIEDLLDARFGEGNYAIRDFEVSYSEEIAKWMNTIAPLLMGLGALLLFIEFKTPGFGVFGIGGLTFLGIFFASHYVAGLAGNEPVFFFLVGVLLLLVELFLFPGTVVFALSGLALMVGSLLWTMVDYWPVPTEGEGLGLTAEMFAEPLVSLIFGISIALGSILLAGRFFKDSWMERNLVLETAAGGDGRTIRDERESKLPQAGRKGVALTTLHPGGRVEIDGQRYEAHCSVGMIECGASVRVVGSSDFDLIVEEISS
jgi:membrane-bound serine protease (ClpP class)